MRKYITPGSVRIYGLPGTDNNPDLPFPYLTDHPPDMRLLGLLGVRYVVRDAATAGTTDANSQGVTIMENPQALPRALLVHTVRATKDQDQALKIVSSPDFDLRTEATSAGRACASGPAGAADRVDLVRNDPERVSAKVTASAAGLLVIGTVDYPGWEATVDGRSQPVLPVDGLIQGICLPAGQHTVELRFTPSQWTLALALSLASLGAVVVFTAWPIRRKSAGRAAISPQPEPIDSRGGPSLL